MPRGEERRGAQWSWEGHWSKLGSVWSAWMGSARPARGKILPWSHHVGYPVTHSAGYYLAPDFCGWAQCTPKCLFWVLDHSVDPTTSPRQLNTYKVKMGLRNMAPTRKMFLQGKDKNVPTTLGWCNLAKIPN